jgi:tRNA A37 threonylcarbamoyladenosine biosynthesis protein TsaE
VLIEWGERFPRMLPADRTEIRIRSIGDDAREIEVLQRGGREGAGA